MKSLLLVFSMVFMAFNAFAHGGNRVDIETDISSISSGSITYRFQLVDEKTRSLVGINDLLVTHEKKLHMLVYDKALEEFVHVHPEFSGEEWSASFSLPKNGEYVVWAQGQLKDQEEFSTAIDLVVSEGSSANPLPPKLGDVRTVTAEGIKVSLSEGRIVAGRPVMLDIAFTDSDGKPANIEPYLGAFAHVIAVSSDGKKMIHVHPMDGKAPNQGMIHATFPKVGNYRMWVQFVEGGKVKTGALSVKVN